MSFNSYKKNAKYILLAVMLMITVQFSSNFISYGEINTNNISIKTETETNYYDNLATAISAVPDNQETVITIYSDIELTSEIKIPENKKIIIESENNNTISRTKNNKGAWYTGVLFRISKNSELTLKNITIDEKNDWELKETEYEEYLKEEKKATDIKFINPNPEGPAFNAWTLYNNGTLTLDKVTIKDRYATGGGLIYGNTASTTSLKETKIEHCASTSGGLVTYITGTNTKFYVEKGTVINNNFVSSNGGLFKTYSNAQLIMNDGEIKNTRGVNANGVISMTYGSVSTFILNGGIIHNNSGLSGPNNGRNAMVYIHSGSKYVMNGGTIENNRGTLCGAIDAPGYTNADIELNGGIIRNNSAYEINAKSSDLYTAHDYDLEIGKDMKISGNVYITGSITNNGELDGKVTLSAPADTEKDVISGSGIITGDLIVMYKGEAEPNINYSAKVNGNIVSCEETTEIIITFDYSGAKDEKGRSYRLISVEKNGIPQIPNIEKEGHSIKWYEDKDLTKEYQNTPLETATTMYANWIKNIYEVTWDVDGVKTTENYTYLDKIELPKTPEKEGYNFIKWTGYSDDLKMPAHNLTFIAEWALKEYEITFDTNGGTKINPLTAVHGTTINKPTNPKLECKKLVGWYIDKELKEKFDFNQTITGDLTLYAKWTSNHNWGEWEYYDEVTHIRKCKNNPNHKEVGKHEGGEATIFIRAICDLCHNEYGNLNEPVKYKMLDDFNKKYIKESKKDLYFISNADIKELIKIEIDEQELEISEYDVDTKKEIVKIKSEYLDDLSLGKHDIKIFYKDGYASDSFEIENASSKTNYLWLWIIPVLLILIGFSYIIIKNKKENKSKQKIKKKNNRKTNRLKK